MKVKADLQARKKMRTRKSIVCLGGRWAWSWDRCGGFFGIKQ
jgi:hypothetical protein